MGVDPHRLLESTIAASGLIGIRLQTAFALSLRLKPVLVNAGILMMVTV